MNISYFRRCSYEFDLIRVHLNCLKICNGKKMLHSGLKNLVSD